MNNKLKAALLGGLIVGVVSGLISLIPIIKMCCCLFAIGGGVVAGLLYIKGSPTRVSVGDGAMVGALAGLVGAVIYLIICLPITLFVGAAEVERTLSQLGRPMPFSGTVLIIVSTIVGAIGLIVLAAIGGILSVPIFEKRKDQIPPPPAAPGGYAA
ncbi:MAG TPA: hypothetical protein VIX17_21375 [Pyrinomonadaceae bacterium]|jgi:hypothetical protein